MKAGASNDAPIRPGADIEALAALPDEQIDLGEMPEVRDWSDARRGLFYRPIKQQLTPRLDAEVIAWFKTRAADGEKYQTAINRVLRDYVEAHGRWA